MQKFVGLLLIPFFKGLYEAREPLINKGPIKTCINASPLTRESITLFYLFKYVLRVFRGCKQVKANLEFPVLAVSAVASGTPQAFLVHF